MSAKFKECSSHMNISNDYYVDETCGSCFNMETGSARICCPICNYSHKDKCYELLQSKFREKDLLDCWLSRFWEAAYIQVAIW